MRSTLCLCSAASEADSRGLLNMRANVNETVSERSTAFAGGLETELKPREGVEGGF